MEILRLRGLGKYYTAASGVVRGLSDTDLSFSRGEFVAVTGESGSGKSTLAHIIAGIIPYEAGEMLVFGEPTSHFDGADWEQYRRDTVSFISQNYGIIPGCSVLDNVMSALVICGADKREAKAAALEILEKVELRDVASRRAGRLSSGQKQRLSIARALAKPSRILVADEPTGNLDRENSDKVIRMLKEAAKTRLVIIVTHEFEEVEDSVSRRIVLSDGKVVMDASIAPPTEQSESPKEKRKPKKTLPFYVAKLTAKARPVFIALASLIMAVSSFITFAFLGTFAANIDDTGTKIYDPTAFRNGSPERIVVMKDGASPFSADEREELCGLKYVEGVEKWGYFADVNYYYRPETDYIVHTNTVNGPNFHPVLNPDDVQVTEAVKFIESELFAASITEVSRAKLTSGRMPEGFYEVVSCDPDYGIGETVTVYFRSRNEWSISSYIKAEMTVVGTAKGGEGLLFSEKAAAALSGRSVVETVKVNLGESFMMFPSVLILLPYHDSIGAPEPSDGEMIMHSEHLLGRAVTVFGNGQEQLFTVSGHTRIDLAGVAYVNEAEFDRFTDMSDEDQISLMLKDYAYSDKVLDSLAKRGYIAVSPFYVGADKTDPTLAEERLVTLAVCAGAFVLAFVLQIILIYATFTSLYGHFKLLSDIGLNAKTAYRAQFAVFALAILIGEAIAAIVIGTLCAAGVGPLVAVYKFLLAEGTLILWLLHFVCSASAYAFLKKGLRRAVFHHEKRKDDMDFLPSED